MSKYFISVIMPIYNAEKYVKKSIDSLVNQTTNEIEIILVDDGSTDGSGSICDQYDGSENVKIIHKEGRMLLLIVHLFREMNLKG